MSRVGADIKAEMARISKLVGSLVAECETFSKEYGARAMEIVGDYPLYAGCSNITYGQAIVIALACVGNIDDYENQDSLMVEYFKTDRKHSLDDFDKWVAER